MYIYTSYYIASCGTFTYFLIACQTDWNWTRLLCEPCGQPLRFYKPVMVTQGISAALCGIGMVFRLWLALTFYIDRIQSRNLTQQRNSAQCEVGKNSWWTWQIIRIKNEDQVPTQLSWCQDVCVGSGQPDMSDPFGSRCQTMSDVAHVAHQSELRKADGEASAL